MSTSQTRKWKTLIAKLDLAVARDGDEWLEHLYADLSSKVEIGWRHELAVFNDPDAVPLYEVQLDSDALRSSLWLEGDPVQAFVVGTGEESEDQVRPWVEAIHVANARLATLPEEFEWQAAIDSVNPGLGGLARDFRVGPFTLIANKSLFYSSSETSLPSFGARGVVCTTTPTVVTGTEKNRRWQAAASKVSERLFLLCGLFALDTASPWTLRQSPVVLGNVRLHVPAHASWDVTAADVGTRQSVNERFELEPPIWMDDVWSSLDKDFRLRAAVLAYQEGTALEVKHPSFALVAYAAAIEEVGVVLERDRSPSTPWQPMKRFSEALDLVLAPDQSKATANRLYGERSSTAHGGKLHGTEVLFGFATLGLLTRNARVEFVRHELRTICELARKILLTKLGAPKDLLAAPRRPTVERI